MFLKCQPTSSDSALSQDEEEVTVQFKNGEEIVYVKVKLVTCTYNL